MRYAELRSRCLDRTADRVDAVVDRKIVHHLAGLVRVRCDAAAIKVGSDAEEAFVGVAGGNVLDVIVEAPPFLDDEDRSRTATGDECCCRAVRGIDAESFIFHILESAAEFFSPRG